MKHKLDYQSRKKHRLPLWMWIMIALWAAIVIAFGALAVFVFLSL